MPVTSGGFAFLILLLIMLLCVLNSPNHWQSLKFSVIRHWKQEEKFVSLAWVISSSYQFHVMCHNARHFITSCKYLCNPGDDSLGIVLVVTVYRRGNHTTSDGVFGCSSPLQWSRWQTERTGTNSSSCMQFGPVLVKIARELYRGFF